MQSRAAAAGCYVLEKWCGLAHKPLIQNKTDDLLVVCSTLIAERRGFECRTISASSAKEVPLSRNAVWKHTTELTPILREYPTKDNRSRAAATGCYVLEKWCGLAHKPLIQNKTDDLLVVCSTLIAERRGFECRTISASSAKEVPLSRNAVWKHTTELTPILREYPTKDNRSRAAATGCYVLEKWCGLAHKPLIQNKTDDLLVVCSTLIAERRGFEPLKRF